MAELWGDVDFEALGWHPVMLFVLFAFSVGTMCMFLLHCFRQLASLTLSVFARSLFQRVGSLSILCQVSRWVLVGVVCDG